MRAAVGGTSQQHVSDAHTVCGRSGTMLKNDKAVPKLSALNYKFLRFSFDSPA